MASNEKMYEQLHIHEFPPVREPVINPGVVLHNTKTVNTELSILRSDVDFLLMLSDEEVLK